MIADGTHQDAYLDVDVQLLGDGHQIGADLLQGADIARSQGDADAMHRWGLSLGLLKVLGHRSGGRSRSNGGSLQYNIFVRIGFSKRVQNFEVR